LSHASEKTLGEERRFRVCMSEKAVDTAEAKVGREGSHRRLNRRTIVIIVIVVCTLIGFIAATSAMTVSKLRIMVVNNADRDMLIDVHVVGQPRQTTVLEPSESVSYSWNVTGWLHSIAIAAVPAGLLINYILTYETIIILPFDETTIIKYVG